MRVRIEGVSVPRTESAMSEQVRTGPPGEGEILDAVGSRTSGDRQLRVAIMFLLLVLLLALQLWALRLQGVRVVGFVQSARIAAPSRLRTLSGALDQVYAFLLNAWPGQAVSFHVLYYL